MIPLCDEKRIGKLPLAVIFLIITNTVIFLATYPNLQYYVDLFGFSSGKLFDGQFFTILTSMFLHANFLHLITNMWFLWVFGNNLEARLGSLRFLAFYLLCGLGAGIVYALAMTSPDTVVIGASGAISGVLGGYLALFPKSRIKTFFVTVFSVPAVIYIFLWFVYQLFSATMINTPVAYWGHIGGFVSGLLFVRFFRK